MPNLKIEINSILLNRQERQYFGISFLVLTGIGVIVFFQKYFKYASSTEYFSVPLSLIYNLIIFSTYALFVPLIVKAKERFPIGKEKRSYNLLVHLGFSIAFGLIHMLLCNLILYTIDLASTPIFERFITKYLTNVVHVHLLVYWVIVGFISIRNSDISDKSNGTLKRFVIKENKYTTFLELEKVHWIEALDHYQKLHTNNGFFLYKDSMSNLIKQLPPSKFKRIHRSSIVNLDKIEGLRKKESQLAVRLQNGQELIIGKSYRSEIRTLFN